MNTLQRVGVAFFCLALLTGVGFAQSNSLVSTVAGNGIAGFSGDGGPATMAQIRYPAGIAIDSVGNLYIADSGNHRVRKVTRNGIISTVAGNGKRGYSGDGGPATSAQLDAPTDIALDSVGNLYIAESNAGHIRKVTTAGVISTLASINAPYIPGWGIGGMSYKMTFDQSGNLYVAWNTNWDFADCGVYKITPTGETTLIVVNMESEIPHGEGEPVLLPGLNNVMGVAVDASGNLLIASDWGYIFRVMADGTLRTVAGGGTNSPGDGGSALAAALSPNGLAIDAEGNIYTADNGSGYSRIRKVTPEGIISTIAVKGTSGYGGDGGPADLTEFMLPTDIAFDSSGSLFIADTCNQRIRKVANANSYRFTSYFPRLAMGDGWSTLFTFVNTGLLEASGNLTTIDPQGNPLNISSQLTDSSGITRSAQVATSVSFVIPPGGTVFLSTAAAEDSMKTGWAQLESLSGPINTMVTYEHALSADTDSIFSVAPSQPTQLAVIPVDIDNSSGKQLAYAIANPNSQAISVNLALMAQDGAVLDSSVNVELGPGEQIVRYQLQDLALPNSSSKFRGSMVFRSQDGQMFLVLALLDKRGRFSAIPVISFP